MDKIWCLFSVDNNYDQPDNNLVGWWVERPSIEEVARFLCRPLDKVDDDTVIRLVEIWKGNQTQIALGDTAYRLEEVQRIGISKLQ